MSTTRDEFDKKGYLLLDSVIGDNAVKILNSYCLRYALNAPKRIDKLVPNTPACYGVPLMEKLLVKLVPKIEGICGKALYPTYSYFRIYKRGDVLPRHRDRHSCEISLSLCLGYDSAEPWPLCVEGASDTFSAKLEPGGGLLYKGIQYTHWRDAFEGGYLAQAFLHYVDKNGIYSDWRFDKREALNL